MGWGKIAEIVGSLFGLPQIIRDAWDWLVKKVANWFKVRKISKEAKKEADAKEKNLSEGLKDENASDEKIERDQLDRLDGW